MKSSQPFAIFLQIMWHPFELIPDTLAPNGQIPSLALPDQYRAVYAEHIIRYFKRERANHRRNVIEKKPGISLKRSKLSSTQRRLDLRHSKDFAVSSHLDGAIIYAASGWRSPEKWTFKYQFNPPQPVAPPVSDQGSFENKNLSLLTKIGKKTRQKQIPADILLNFYTLLADFPHEQAALEWSDQVLVMEESSIFAPGASLLPASSDLQNHPFAQKHSLSGRILNYKGGTPIEFWFNQNKTPVIVIMNLTRVFLLESMEALS